MPRYVNHASRPVDLDTGQMLAPGDRADAEPSQRHDALVTAGDLVVEPEPAPMVSEYVVEPQTVWPVETIPEDPEQLPEL